MRKILLLLLAGLQIRAAEAQFSGHPPYLQKSLSGESLQRVELETSGGNISVYGVPAAEARLEVYVRGNHDGEGELSKEEIEKRLNEQYDLNISVNDHKLTAIAKGKSRNMNWRRGLSISFKAYVPQAVSSDLRTSGGNISLKNLSGATQEFHTSGGNLDVDLVSGKLTGRTSGGNISLTDSKDDIDLQTSGGNIQAVNCQGSIKLGTSGGNLTLRLLKGNVRATTSGGSVVGEAITGELQTRTSGGNIRMRDMSCSLSASTSAGNIDVEMNDAGKYLSLSTSGGNISLLLPQGKGMDLQLYGEEVKASSLDNFKGQLDGKHIDGAINGGGLPVKVDNSGGRISLSFK
ncbi:MAG TPA: DUF4097 family beta strand repeat-containing protein [Puia sp.]